MEKHAPLEKEQRSNWSFLKLTKLRHNSFMGNALFGILPRWWQCLHFWVSGAVWNCAAWQFGVSSWSNLKKFLIIFVFFHQTYMSPTRLTIFHCALGLRMQASGPANPFSTENCFVWRYSPQIRRAQARLPLFLSHPAEFGVFFWRIGKTYPEVVVLDALLRDEVFCL